jgi:hypothetical protein
MPTQVRIHEFPELRPATSWLTALRSPWWSLEQVQLCAGLCATTFGAPLGRLSPYAAHAVRVRVRALPVAGVGG